MIKVKTILNNCISDIISNNKFNRIFVYGSENLELEKLIYNLTSSPIIGGDVDFCNVLFGKYFSNNKDLDLNEEIYKELELDISSPFLSNMKDYDEYLETATMVSKCLNIKNLSTTFLAMIKLAKENIDNLKELAFKNKDIDNVPLTSILGRSDVYKDDALVIDKALNRMINKGKIKNFEKEKGLAILAKLYLEN